MQTKTKPKAKLLEEPEAAPIIGPQTFEAWVRSTMRAVEQKDASPADRAEFRRLLELRPAASEIYGDMATMYRRISADRFASLPIAQESIKHRMEMMRAELVGEHPRPLESLLVDCVLACYHDYWTFAILVEQKTSSSFTLQDMEKWEHILASKETRYLRAVETLARVRRLLNLPAPQVNINLPGGQQVNVQGKVES